jgi:cell division protein FtsL
MLGYIAEYALVARAAHVRADLRRELYHLRQENTNLRARVATLERPSRIENLARSQGMKQRSEAVFVSMAPKALPPTQAEQRPVLAGFLPESVAALFRGDSSARK